MQQNIPEQNHYQEDEIDLKELFKTLWLKKNLIISITTAITILAGVYAFNKTPIYQATALVEIGSYKFHNAVSINNKKIKIDDPGDLAKKLNLLFPKVTVSKPNKLKSFI
jgi:LPS O-antigen subunit length determinant protein (WzzB/FepE family)